MPSLFDSLGPAFRAPDVSAALESLAAESEVERGAVFTRPEVAAAILDLCGYTADRAPPETGVRLHFIGHPDDR